MPHDHDGNAVAGDVVTLDTHRSLIRSENILTTVIGIDEVIVVAEADAVLVTSRAKSHLVNDLVGALRASGWSEANEHHRMHQP